MSGRWEPLDHFTSLRDAMTRLMDQSVIFAGKGSEGSMQTVPVNVFESNDTLMVMAAMPGVEEDDIEITARGNSLTIEARERADLKPNEPGKRYIRHEWRYGPYQRIVELPYQVNANSATAAFSKGVLTVRLTKAETERSHKINVKGPVAQQ